VAQSAAAQGIRYAVHTFNAMRPFAHRDPGVVGAVLLNDQISAELIADGAHVDPHVVQLFARLKAPSRVLLVTDAMCAAGMPDGEYELAGRKVRVTDGICVNDEGRLAGSTLTQDAALRNYLEWTGVRLEEALMAVTSNVADALSLEGRGRLVPGARADFVLLDRDMRVVKTMIEGKMR
jgi:N-acetylglucosamine-6-phosphate deacetylase